jgi:glycosyltransferase involved in cell wall biosynthesis
VKILMVVPQAFYSPRGTPLSAYHRTRDLRALGHEVEILTYAVGDPPPDPDLKVFRSIGPHFASRIKQGPSYLKIWFDFLILLNLVGRLLRGRYDLIYAHEEGAFIALLVAPLFRLPVVYDMHSSLPRQITEWQFSRSEAVVGFFRWVERFILRRSLAVVAIAPGLAERARSIVPEVRLVTIVNRFALDAEASPEDAARIRKELGLTPGQPVVLYTGSFVRLQALDLLVQGIPTVAARVPDVRFVLVGGRPAEIEELRWLGEHVGATPNLILLPERPQAEMPAFMAAASVLVSPRVHGINPPGKLFSYLNSGRPIVATDCEVHTQFLTSRCAILTRPDAASFAQGVIEALTDEPRATALTKVAREVLANDYSDETRARAYRQLLDLISPSDGRSNSRPLV